MVCFIRLTGRDKLISEGLFDLKDNPGTGLCCVRGCRHKFRLSHPSLRLCHRHYQERWRSRNPKQAAFRALKDHAVARRIPFTLTLQTFLRITEAAGYWSQDPASHGDRLSIDRIDVTLGYADDNVQVLTVSENVIKGNRERFLSPEVQAIIARRRGVPDTTWSMAGPTESSWLDEESGDPF